MGAPRCQRAPPGTRGHERRGVQLYMHVHTLTHAFVTWFLGTMAFLEHSGTREEKVQIL